VSTRDPLVVVVVIVIVLILLRVFGVI